MGFKTGFCDLIRSWSLRVTTNSNLYRTTWSLWCVSCCSYAHLERKTGIFTLSPSRLWHGISLLKAGWVLHEWCHYIFLAQMHRFKTDDPDIRVEFMQGNFCITKKERPFCAIGPDHAIEHVNKLMKVREGHSNQQPWQDGSLRSQNWVDLRRKLRKWWDYKELHHHTIMI